MQEQTLNRTRETDASSFENQQITKSSNVSLGKSNQNRRSNNVDKFIKSEKHFIFKDLSTSRKRVYEISNANYLSRVKYFECYKKRHYKKKCLN